MSLAGSREEMNDGSNLINKVIVTVAQTGAITNKKQNPNVPEQPDEIAASALACLQRRRGGGSHPRPRQERREHLRRRRSSKTFTSRIRDVCPMVIEDSTGGGPNLTQEQRLECLAGRPGDGLAQHGQPDARQRQVQGRALVEYARRDRVVHRPHERAGRQAGARSLRRTP